MKERAMDCGICLRDAGKRKGFSLIAVLIIALIGMVLIGTVTQFTVTSSGTSRISSASNAKYNILQDAVEEGKSILKRSMDNLDPIPRYTDGTKVPTVKDTDKITSTDMLLLTDAPSNGGPALGRAVDRILSKGDLGSLGIVGTGGILSVRIYDMQYDQSNVPPIGYGTGEISPEEFSMIPPSIYISGTAGWDRRPLDAWSPDDIPIDPASGGAENSGVYLVRATLTVDGASIGNNVWVLESAIIQANRM